MLVVVTIGIVITSGDDDAPRASDDQGATATSEQTTTDTVEQTTPVVETTPTIRTSTRPADLDMTLVDSPWAPTPCPTDRELVGCIFAGVAVDGATGEIIAPYFTEGFTPELEPAGDHLHFYLDTAVAGDERKAGTEVPGGAWKPWDGPSPFTSFGGDNGRTGFTLGDVEAASARLLCVLVSDSNQRAIPGSGNCAPIAQVFDPAAYAVQVGRIEGTYIGSCGLRTTLIVPTDWRWFDLVNEPLDQTAASLRPTRRDEMRANLEALVADGGVLWADGPVVKNVITTLTIKQIDSDVTTASSPDEVASALAGRGVDVSGAVDREVGGRRLLVRTTSTDTTASVTYLIPDFGYTIVLQISGSPRVEATVPTDQIAATVLGC